MSRRQLPALVGLVIACVVLCVSSRSPSKKGLYSRHCPVDKNEGKMNAPKYTGEFDVVFLAKGGKAQGIESILVRVHGSLEIRTFEGKVHDLKGGVDYLFAGSGLVGGVMALGLNFAGEGDLRINGPSLGTRFDGKAPLKLKGGASARVPTGHKSFLGSAGGDLNLKFMIEQATCDIASGTFASPELLQTAAALRDKGFQVPTFTGRWQVSSGTDASKKQQELIKQLNKPSPPGIYRRREAEAVRLGKLADDIKLEEPAVRDCLLKIWLQHVRKRLNKEALEDLNKINGYKGDPAGLDDLMQRALATCRMLALIGLDECEEELYKLIWEAISGKLGDMLERMVKRGAPLHDILKVLRNAELLGEIAPALEKQVREGTIYRAEQLVDVYLFMLKQAVKANKKDPCNPQVKKAITQALHASKMYELLGGPRTPSTDVLSYVSSLSCGQY
jgi:hypothetical protein